MEGYHVLRTHPQLVENNLPGANPITQHSGPAPWQSLSAKEVVDYSLSFLQTLSDGMAGMVHASDIAVARDIAETVQLPDDPTEALVEWNRLLNSEITKRAQARNIPMPDLNDLAENHPASPVQFVFPHHFLLPMFGNMSSYRVRPLTAETCLFEIWSLVLYPEGTERDRPIAPTPMRHDDERFPLIPKQDYSNLPLQQLGLHGGRFDNMLLARDVEGLISNYQRTIDGFLYGADKSKLVSALQIASGEFDAPIKDMGL